LEFPFVAGETNEPAEPVKSTVDVGELSSVKRIALSLFVLAAMSNLTMAQERVWSLDASGEDAFLVYGVPESDDVGVSVWCKIGTPKTSLFFPVTWTSFKDEEVIPIEVVLGEASFKLSGKATTSEGSSIEAKIPEGTAFFDAMKAADRIKLNVGTHKSVYPLADAQIDGLLKLCQQTVQAE
jgi:hypothetical protein